MFQVKKFLVASQCDNS